METEETTAGTTEVNEVVEKPKRKTRKTLSLSERIEVIRVSEQGRGIRKLAEQFGVGKTQISQTLKRKAEWQQLYSKPGSETRKRLKVTCVLHAVLLFDFNRVLYTWIVVHLSTTGILWTFVLRCSTAYSRILYFPRLPLSAHLHMRVLFCR